MAAAGDLRPMVLGVCWALTGLSSLFLSLRLYVKSTAHRKFYWDDFLLAASWLMLVAFSVTATNGTRYGLGLHQADKERAFNDPSNLRLMVVIATVFSVLGAAWSKTSVAVTLLRLTSGTLHYGIWLVVVSMNVVLTFNAILQFLWCQPASVAWSSGTGRGGTCWSRNVIVSYSIAAAAYSAAMDILLAIVPWFVIMGLNMQMKEKIGAAVCMSLGIVAAMTSIMRAIYLPSVYVLDYSWEESKLFVWTAAELATTIIAASIPVLRVFLRNMVEPKQRRKCEGPLSTFKPGFHTCSSVSPSRIHRHMNTDVDVAVMRLKHSYSVREIYEEGESEVGLDIGPEYNFSRDLGQGGILITHEVEVLYDNGPAQPPYVALGLRT